MLALDLARVAFIEPHWDEDALLAAGWLLARGWKLYSGVFSHHLPFDYLPAWLLSLGGFEILEGARVLIDPKAVMYLLGTEMDYKTDKLASQFVFTNPNQTGSCGCGESVNLAPAGSDKLEALRG